MLRLEHLAVREPSCYLLALFRRQDGVDWKSLIGRLVGHGAHRVELRVDGGMNRLGIRRIDFHWATSVSRVCLRASRFDMNLARTVSFTASTLVRCSGVALMSSSMSLTLKVTNLSIFSG